MSLKAQVLDATKVAMKEKDKARITVLRSFSAAVKQQEIDGQKALSDAEQLAVLDKLIKQRKDSESQFRQAGRDDLADNEQQEIVLLSQFLPAQLSDDEITAIISAAVTESGATSMADMGKVMAIVKPQVQGKVDMGAISQLVKSQF